MFYQPFEPPGQYFGAAVTTIAGACSCGCGEWCYAFSSESLICNACRHPTRRPHGGFIKVRQSPGNPKLYQYEWVCFACAEID